MNILPTARFENLVEQNLGKETLIYDLTTHKAFNLNETLATVYKACDGKTSFAELKRRSKFTDDFIYLALDELKRENLLTEDYHSPFVDVNRREVIKKVGLTTMLALPLIAGLVAPSAANAASGLTNPVNPQRAYIEGPCGPPPSCYGTAGFCQSTHRGERCCIAYGSAADTRFSGESFTMNEYFPIYKVIHKDAPRTDSTACRTLATCCDGRKAYGTVNYTPTDTELDHPNYQDHILVNIEGTCYCP